jgi:hypothetical protein
MRRLLPRVILVGLLMLGIVAMHHIAGTGYPEQPAAATSVVGVSVSSGAPTSTVTPDGGHAGAAEQHAGHAAGGDASSGHSGHHLLHLCLAILTAAVLALGLRLLRLRALAVFSPGLGYRVQATAPPRPPRPHGFPLLLSLSVIRV